MLLYSKWRRIFVRKSGKYFKFKNTSCQPICYQAATLAKCCDGVKHCKSLKNDKSKPTQLTSRDMMRDRSFVANISIANTRICEKCLPKLDK